MAEPKENPLMEKIVSLCKRRGFIFQSSEIYGGINGFWDYGPLGAELKRNVKEIWWRTMVHNRDDIVGLEATIIMSPEIWKASGHVDTFSDPMCDCLLTKKRFRADQVEPQSGVAYYFACAVQDEHRTEALHNAAVNLDAHKALLEKMPPETRKRYEFLLTEYWDQIANAGFDPNRLPKIDTRHFSVLVKPGPHEEASARKTAMQFYKRDGLEKPLPILEKKEAIENTTGFNPENGAELTPPRPFNLMFKTYVGPVADEENVAYLRPETAQAIFAQFKNVLETSRQKVPFGIAQMGKAFRNEVTPRNFTFRSREFEQMELEFFIKPDEVIEAIKCSVSSVQSESSELKTENLKLETSSAWGWEAWHKYWVEERIKFYEGIGLPRATLEEYWQKPEELAHYARATVDLLFKFPFGAQELEGIAARSDFDLSQHERFSGKPMGVFDDELRAAWGKLPKEKQDDLRRRYYEHRKKYLTKTARPDDTPEQIEKDAKEDADGLAKGNYIPHVIEPSAGVDRLILALICHAYSEDQAPDDKGKPETRVVMRFHPRVAPIKVAVFPLLKNKPDLVAKAKEVRDLLRPHMTVFYDDTGAIGRRYRRQDEAGTPFGVTIDFDTLGEKGAELKDTVTLRDRDTMKQERVKIGDLLPLLLDRVR